MTQDDTGATLQADMVTIKLPAAGAYLSVLRTATAGLAARLDFTLDEIEDLRIAVDEACAMLLAQAVPGADLVAVGQGQLADAPVRAGGVHVAAVGIRDRGGGRDLRAALVGMDVGRHVLPQPPPGSKAFPMPI